MANEAARNIFQRCAEASNEAMMITDLGGRLAYVNPAWSRIYGYPSEEALGSTPRLLHSGLHDRAFYERMWRDIRDPRVGSWRGEVTNRTRGGDYVPVLLTIAPLRERDAVVGYMGIAVDIRELKDYQAKVLQQDRLASIGLLASGLAHEIGNPLAVARGRAELVGMRLASDPAATADLQAIVDQIDRISQLIRTLLRFSRARGSIHEALHPTTLRPVLLEVESLVASAIRGAQVALKVELPSDLRVLGDQQRLQQVFLNLVINAVHAIEAKAGRGPEGRVVEVSSRPDPSDASMVEVTVRDTGCGISQANLARIFQPFFTTKDVGRGTGLGLSIVSKLVDELGGDIRAQSTEGSGSVFTVRLRRGEDLRQP